MNIRKYIHTPIAYGILTKYNVNTTISIFTLEKLRKG